MFIWPHWRPPFKPNKLILNVQSCVAAIGCLVFCAGSCLSLAEAVNKNRRNCPSWIIQPFPLRQEDDEVGPLRFRESPRVYQFPTTECWHRHDEYRIVALDFESSTSGSPSGPCIQRPRSRSQRHKRYRYFWPWKTELRKHFCGDWDVIAAFIIAASSVLYCVLAFAAVGTTSRIDKVATGIRYPQIVAGIGFVISCSIPLFKSRTSFRPPDPELGLLCIRSCHLLGSCGFLATTICGIVQQDGTHLDCHMCGFWFGGAILFFFGSVVGWYKSLEGYPVSGMSRSKQKADVDADADVESQAEGTEMIAR